MSGLFQRGGDPDLRVRRSDHLAPGRHGRRDFRARSFVARWYASSRTVHCVLIAAVARHRAILGLHGVVTAVPLGNRWPHEFLRPHQRLSV